MRTGVGGLVVAAATRCVARGTSSAVAVEATKKRVAGGHAGGIYSLDRNVAVDRRRQTLRAARAIALRAAAADAVLASAARAIGVCGAGVAGLAAPTRHVGASAVDGCLRSVASAVVAARVGADPADTASARAVVADRAPSASSAARALWVAAAAIGACLAAVLRGIRAGDAEASLAGAAGAVVARAAGLLVVAARTFGSAAAAIDSGFVSTRQAIVAARRLTRPVPAYTTGTIARLGAGRAGGAARTVTAAAVDQKLASALHTILTRTVRAEPGRRRAERAARAIGVLPAGLRGGACVASAAAIDAGLVLVASAVVTGCRGAARARAAAGGAIQVAIAGAIGGAGIGTALTAVDRRFAAILHSITATLGARHGAGAHVLCRAGVDACAIGANLSIRAVAGQCAAAIGSRADGRWRCDGRARYAEVAELFVGGTTKAGNFVGLEVILRQRAGQ